MFDNAFTLINEANDIGVFCHISPDGDTLGAALAIKHALTATGKRARVFSVSVPGLYGFLPGASDVLTQPPEAAPELAIAADVSDLHRLGSFLPVFNGSSARLCVDHHATNPGFGDVNIIMPDASSTCEVVYDMLLYAKLPITHDIAVNLFVGMSTDTKHFVFNSTSPGTLRAAAALLETGININEIARRLYFLRTAAKTRLIGSVLSSLELYFGGRFAVLTCSEAQRNECGAGYDDLEGIINYAIETENVEIACLLRDSSANAVKGSVRITEPHDAAAFAAAFGGGGHKAAAGFTIEGATIGRAKSMVITEAGRVLA